MWDKLTVADIEEARRQLAKTRAETLTRHAEELKAIDAEQDAIDVFEQQVARFAQKHLNSRPGAPSLAPPSPDSNSSAVVAADVVEVDQDTSEIDPPPQQPAPDFQTPPRFRFFARNRQPQE